MRDSLSESQYFSEQLAERIRGVQDENLAKGKLQGGTPPWGYRLTDELYLEPDPESPTRRAAALLIEHRGDTRKVADQLNEEG